jgi:hypothetical protein
MKFAPLRRLRTGVGIACHAVAALICCATAGFAQEKPEAPKVPATQADSAKPGGGDNGTDPSAFARRVLLYNDFNRLGDGIDVNVVYLDQTYPVLKDKHEVPRGLLKVEMQFVEAQRNLNLLPLPPGSPAAPGAVSGVGDILFRLFAIPWYNEKKTFKVLTGVDLYVPSAQGDLIFPNASSALSFVSLGTGKYRVAPAVGFVWSPKPNILFAPLYWYDASVAGDPDRPTIRLGKLKIFGMYAFPFGLYFLPELQVVSNYSDIPDAILPLIRRTEVFIRPEVGQVLGKDGTTFYLKPGWGINDPRALNRKWGLEGGFRLGF